MAEIDQAQLQEAVREEVEDLHTFFDDWFRGDCEESPTVMESRCASHLSPEFQLIYPGGRILTRENLLNGLAGAYGKSPGYKTQIRDVRLRPMGCHGYLLANYEEWQKNAVNSTPPDNGRLSSAVLRIVESEPVKLQWLHLHETWLPEDVISADPFDF